MTKVNKRCVGLLDPLLLYVPGLYQELVVLVERKSQHTIIKLIKCTVLSEMSEANGNMFLDTLFIPKGK